MKKLSLILAVILLSSKLFAQGEVQVQAELNNIFVNIDKSQIPHGYLSEYGGDFVEKRFYNGVLGDSNLIEDIGGFRFLYNDIRSARLYTGAYTMPTLQNVNNTMAAFTDSSSSALVFLTARYATLNENAINLGLFTASNNQIYDVAGRSQSPYLQQQAFAAVPAESVSKVLGSLRLTWAPGLAYTNTSQTIVQVWIDFLDGQGYQSLAANNTIIKTYTDSSGYKKFVTKVLCSDGATLYCTSQQYVQVNNSGLYLSRFATFDPIELSNPAYTALGQDFYKAKVYIRYSKKRTGTALNGKIVKPFIIVEGYDIHDVAPGIKEENYDVNKLIGDWDLIQGYDLNGQLDDEAGYDLIFVDYYTMDEIPRNAAMLENVINWVNTNKVNNAVGVLEQNVVMGISMGGIVSRYCLASMTKRSQPTQTRLLLTQDSPHQGANVPMGLQHFLYDLGEMTIVGQKIGEQSKKLEEFYLLSQQPATQSQLILRVLDGHGNYTTNSFLAPNGPYRQMVDFLQTDPIPSYTFKAVSQGSQCGQRVMAAGTNFVDYSDNISVLRGAIGLVASPKYKLTVIINALPEYGSSNTVSYSKMQRNIRLFFGIIGTGWITTFNNTRPSPAATIPWDCVPGGTQSLSSRNGNIGDDSYTPSVDQKKHQTVLGNLWRDAVFPLVHLRTDFSVPYLQDLFTFVPITSSLDIADATNNSFNRSYIFPLDGLAGSRSIKYIAQEKFTNTISGQPVNFYNLNHTVFTKRNAEWIYNEMQNTTANDCFANCSYEITGNESLSCSTTYSISPVPNATYFWTFSSNLDIPGSRTGTSAVVTPLSFSGTGWIDVTITTTNCGSFTIRKNVSIIDFSDGFLTIDQDIFLANHPTDWNVIAYKWYKDGVLFRQTTIPQMKTNLAYECHEWSVSFVLACGESGETYPPLSSGCGFRVAPKEFVVYPNPVTAGGFYVKLKDDGLQRILLLKDKNARTWRTRRTKSGLEYFQVADLPNATYFLSIQTGNKREIHQVIINKTQ